MAPPARATHDRHGRLLWEPRPGDVVRLRAAHACGEARMVLTALALDARLSCARCGRRVVVDRRRLRHLVADVLGVISDFPELRQSTELS